MKKIRYAFFIALSFALTFLLSGCKLALLDPKGFIAADEKHIMIVSLLLMLVVVVPVIVLTFVTAWFYRAGNTKAVYSPNWSHSTVLEFVWWSIPCIIIVLLGAITWTSSFRLDPYKPLVSEKKPLVIQVIALEWKWLFIYPEQNIATTNFLQFPIGVPIEFLITAEGPMNSFQIPQLGGQIYAMAGMQTKLHLIADSLGEYQGVSANFSGEGFSSMRFVARASTQEQFDRWVKIVKHASNSLTTMSYQKLMSPSIDQGVKYFSSANQQLFSDVMMKSMMPMPMKGMATDSQHKMIASTK